MKYMLLMYWDQSKVPPQISPEEQQAGIQSWHPHGAENKAAGVLESNSGLSPATDTTTVRVRDGKTVIGDGPFAETHEQLGGYYILDCKDLDEAISWAAKIPSAKDGTIEVRPVWGQK